MASLASLSNELKLLVIEQLDVPKKGPATPGEDEEKIVPIANTDILYLSCVNRTFRVLAAPFLFRTIILSNNDKSGTAVHLISTGPYANHVQKVEFLPAIPMPPDPVVDPPTPEKMQDFIPKPEDFPSIVEEVLSHLDRFPNLEQVGIQFIFEVDLHTDGFYHFQDPETVDEILYYEESEGWRALMKDSYAALCRNSPGTIKSLIFQDLVAKETSIWRSDAWRSLLGSLDCLEINLRGGENGAGWCMSTNDGYEDWVGCFDVLFFDHLHKAKALKVQGTPEGPIGLIMDRVAPLSFRAEHMPRLQRLELGYIFIGAPTVTFLSSHAKTLTHVRLVNTRASQLGYSSGEDGDMEWSTFLTILLNTDPAFPCLQSFEVNPMPQRSTIEYERQREGDEMKDKGVSWRGEEGKQWEGWNVLCYGSMNGKYGSIYGDVEDEEGQRARGERDWAVWKQFQGLLERNRTKAGLSET